VELTPSWAENRICLAEAFFADMDLARAKAEAKRALVALERKPCQAAAQWRSQAKTLLRQIREKRHRNRDTTNF
jgi:hypothetical protein